MTKKLHVDVLEGPAYVYASLPTKEDIIIIIVSIATSPVLDEEVTKMGKR